VLILSEQGDKHDRTIQTDHHGGSMSAEEIALVLEYLHQRGVDKKQLHKAIDLWWKIKSGKL
jgi:hypothetical protein